MMMSAACVRPGQRILSQFTAGHVTLIRVNRREIENVAFSLRLFYSDPIKKGLRIKELTQKHGMRK